MKPSSKPPHSSESPPNSVESVQAKIHQFLFEERSEKERKIIKALCGYENDARSQQHAYIVLNNHFGEEFTRLGPELEKLYASCGWSNEAVKKEMLNILESHEASRAALQQVVSPVSSREVSPYADTMHVSTPSPNSSQPPAEVAGQPSLEQLVDEHLGEDWIIVAEDFLKESKQMPREVTARFFKTMIRHGLGSEGNIAELKTLLLERMQNQPAKVKRHMSSPPRLASRPTADETGEWSVPPPMRLSPEELVKGIEQDEREGMATLLLIVDDISDVSAIMKLTEDCDPDARKAFLELAKDVNRLPGNRADNVTRLIAALGKFNGADEADDSTEEEAKMRHTAEYRIAGSEFTPAQYAERLTPAGQDMLQAYLDLDDPNDADAVTALRQKYGEGMVDVVTQVQGMKGTFNEIRQAFSLALTGRPTVSFGPGVEDFDSLPPSDVEPEPEVESKPVLSESVTITKKAPMADMFKTPPRADMSPEEIVENLTDEGEKMLTTLLLMEDMRDASALTKLEKGYGKRGYGLLAFHALEYINSSPEAKNKLYEALKGPEEDGIAFSQSASLSSPWAPQAPKEDTGNYAESAIHQRRRSSSPEESNGPAAIINKFVDDLPVPLKKALRDSLEGTGEPKKVAGGGMQLVGNYQEILEVGGLVQKLKEQLNYSDGVLNNALLIRMNGGTVSQENLIETVVVKSRVADTVVSTRKRNEEALKVSRLRGGALFGGKRGSGS